MSRDYMEIVEGLLAKAQSTDHPEEAETFLAKAQELMARHAIDEAMLAEHGQRDRGTVETITIVCEPPYASPKTSLLNSVAAANDCRAIRVAKRDAAQIVQVVGYGVDLEHVKVLYTSLSVQATGAMFAEPNRSKRFRHAFLVGFAGKVGVRLAAGRRQAQDVYERNHQQAGGSVALVLASKRDSVDDAFRAAFPHARDRRMTYSSTAGAVAGNRAGERADIGQSRVGSRRALPKS